jgi:hypothetical protein
MVVATCWMWSTAWLPVAIGLLRRCAVLESSSAFVVGGALYLIDHCTFACVFPYNII